MGIAFSYNSRNQATSITHPGVAAVPMSYADVDNTERVSAGGADFVNGPLGVTARTAAGATTYYTRAPSGQILAERTPGGGTYYYFIDGSSNVRGLFTKAGAVAARYSYTPYGEEVAQAQPDPAVHDANPWRLAAGYFDIEGDAFYHFGARYYNRSGSWTQQDSYPGQVINPNSVNRYLYARADPVDFVDRSGHDIDDAMLYLGSAFAFIGGAELLATSAAVFAAVDFAAMGGLGIAVSLTGVGLLLGGIAAIGLGIYLGYVASE